MLHFIETLSTMEPLPSFATTDGLIESFHAKMFDQAEVTRKRESLHRVMTLLASAAGMDVHPDDHDDWGADLKDLQDDA